MPKMLFIGDVVGKPGRRVVASAVRRLRDEHGLDFVVANGENAAGGAGITAAIADELKAAGVDAVTLGDHVWDQRGFDKEIDLLRTVCRPANLPGTCPGRRWVVLERDGFRLAVFTVLGRHFMGPKVDCPFGCADSLFKELRGEADAFFVEVHAEATSEKISLGWYLDGRAAAVAGTHTHVPTADGRVLPRGTGYITDVGMTGPYESCLGREIQPVLARFLDGMPRRFGVAERDVRLCGALFEIDPATKACTAMRRVEVTEGGGGGED